MAGSFESELNAVGPWPKGQVWVYTIAARSPKLYPLVSSLYRDHIESQYYRVPISKVVKYIFNLVVPPTRFAAADGQR
jgi:hypothetical protein